MRDTCNFLKIQTCFIYDAKVKEIDAFFLPKAGELIGLGHHEIEIKLCLKNHTVLSIVISVIQSIHDILILLR